MNFTPDQWTPSPIGMSLTDTSRALDQQAASSIRDQRIDGRASKLITRAGQGFKTISSLVGVTLHLSVATFFILPVGVGVSMRQSVMLASKP